MEDAPPVSRPVVTDADAGSGHERSGPAQGTPQALFDALAPEYDDHFAAPHRRAYDDLAWERVVKLLPSSPATVVDVGCGTGRWAPRLTDLGHTVIGIEPAPAMVAGARARAATLNGRFQVIEGTVESADLPARHADVVLAMGSLQYSEDPAAALVRISYWLRPGGVAAVLVDSLVALVVELLRDGRPDEAIERAETGRGMWRTAGMEAPVHLFDASTLIASFESAGLVDVEAAGLLVSASVSGRPALDERLAQDSAGVLALERRLAQHPVLADLGKQLLVTGRTRRRAD